MPDIATQRDESSREHISNQSGHRSRLLKRLGMTWFAIMVPLLSGCTSAIDEQEALLLESQLQTLASSVDSLNRKLSALTTAVDSLRLQSARTFRPQHLTHKATGEPDSTQTVSVESGEGRLIGYYGSDEGISAEFAYWVKLTNLTDEDRSIRYMFLFFNMQDKVITTSPTEEVHLGGSASELIWQTAHPTVRFPNRDALNSVKYFTVEIHIE